MMDNVEQNYKRFGCYPRELLAEIYYTRSNRADLKEKRITYRQTSE